MDPIFYFMAGVWGIAMVVVLIQAIRLSYRVESRSPELVNRSGLPRRAMIVHTVSNWKVARDPETQALRSQMNRLLLFNLAGFALMGLALAFVRE